MTALWSFLTTLLTRTVWNANGFDTQILSSILFTILSIYLLTCFSSLQPEVLLLGDTLSNYYILMLESMLVHMHSLYALSLYRTDCLLIFCYLPISNNLKWQSKTLTFRMHLLVKIEFKNSSRYATFSHLCLYFVFLYSLLFSMFIALCL